MAGIEQGIAFQKPDHVCLYSQEKKCNEQRRSPVVGPSRLAVKDIVFRQQSKTVTFQLRSAGMRSILCAA